MMLQNLRMKNNESINEIFGNCVKYEMVTLARKTNRNQTQLLVLVLTF